MLRETLEVLLQGGFICQISHPTLFSHLQDEEVQQKVNAVLEPLGKRLGQTDSGESYYCAYHDLSNLKDARSIQSQFERLRDQIAPVVYFLTLLMRIENRDSVLIPGEIIRFHDLLSRIEEEPAYLSELQQMGRYELFKRVRQTSNTNARLMVVLETMQKEGYIVLTNSESSIYQVTGKIEHFYACLEFIQEYEQIPLEDENDEQQDLNLER